MKTNIQKLQDDIHDWADKTFGKERKPISAAYHLKEEVNELIEALESQASYGNEETLMEFADCFILILNISSKYGLNIAELTALAETKMRKNKQRLWGKPDENGIVKHIKGLNGN